ncbi:putative nuclear autoantigenic sperm protein, partial [Operophtera brumata]
HTSESYQTVLYSIEQEEGENGEAAEGEKTGEAEAVKENGEASSVEKSEAESTTKKEGKSPTKSEADILFRRVQEGGGDGARALLADVHLALGEVALESETYDKAVLDMHAITHFKNAANILGTRIKALENPRAADDATVKKYTTADPGYSIEGEIKELKELLPEIQEKIQDMMDYKAEVRPCDCIEETRKMLRGMILKEKHRPECQV